MDRIAEGNALRFHDVLVSRCIPELDKINLDIDLRLGQVGGIDIVLGIFPECRFARLFLKIAGTVQHGDLLVRN